jgi:hypothetical protein
MALTDDELRAEVERLRAEFGSGEGLAIEVDYMLAERDRFKKSRRLPDGSYLLVEGWESVFEAGWFARSEYATHSKAGD